MNRLKLFTALLAGVCSSAAFAQSHGPVEVSGAVQQDVLGSLRNVKPNPADYRKMKPRAEHDLLDRVVRCLRPVFCGDLGRVAPRDVHDRGDRDRDHGQDARLSDAPKRPRGGASR